MKRSSSKSRLRALRQRLGMVHRPPREAQALIAEIAAHERIATRLLELVQRGEKVSLDTKTWCLVWQDGRVEQLQPPGGTR